MTEIDETASMNAAKKWLRRGWKLLDEIEVLKKSKREALARATSITAGIGERASGGKGRRNDSALVSIAQYNEDIDARIAELHKILKEISSSIYAVENVTSRVILISRYLHFETWEQIAVEMNYSWKQIHRLHAKALSEIKMTHNVT